MASRIDYALVSQGISSMVSNITYIPAAKTDHAACFVSIDIHKNSRGTGYWKLNCDLLFNNSFKADVNELLDNCLNSETLHPIN